MKTLTHNPARNCFNSLGIPVDNLTLEEAVARIVSLARRRDGRARLVSTLNVDFLVNALGTRFSHARHPELLDVLRNSELVTADGFPIVWLSRIAGKPLQQRVCGSDIAPLLARRASETGLSLFLLGGAEGVAERTGRLLQAENPGLVIAGTAAPMVRTAGPGLAACIADDEALVEQINASGADVLLLGLGNPKQELWFNRNRHRLQVPVSIGVGGTFEFITGGVSRAPAWVRRGNLEWLYRITQDPARLWRRYARGLFKLAALSAPLIATRALEVMAFSGRGEADAAELKWSRLWCSRDQALSIVRLPGLVSARQMQAVAEQVQREAGSGGLHLIDFSLVRRIEIAGHQALFTLAELQRSHGDILLLGIGPGLERQLAACRVIDVLDRTQGDTLSSLNAGPVGSGAALSCRTYVTDSAVLIFLAGRVDAAGLAGIAFVESLAPMVRQRRCVVDLRGVTLLESSGIAALEPVLDGCAAGGGRVALSGASDSARQMIRMAGLDAPVTFYSDNELIAIISGDDNEN
jgi:N-acetylglucosaminyldiphosphoundecaprenol N-acetyl-beta-D-mannosaminyltransferase